MIGRIKKALCRWLLKIDWVKLEVEAYKNVQKKKLLAKGEKEYHEHWSRILRGNTIRTEDKIIVDYSDCRMLGQRPVVPQYVDSTNWGVSKSDPYSAGPCEVEQV